ncbi:Aste57867_17515 [Aphanomyces stellatus]|uniref:Aste57867_17515 protein n=1 Tax=Aphanomyces stellatus TaxID=120398 RepID=A0A485L8T3_9STRA|nr:hypothetical protein As57867_017455 [Aphanomyces stellatus]VFT94268.1 Aste57867_17515 [Aphanomyces stellatus]
MSRDWSVRPSVASSIFALSFCNMRPLGLFLPLLVLAQDEPAAVVVDDDLASLDVEPPADNVNAAIVPTLPFAKTWYKCDLNTTVFNESKPITDEAATLAAIETRMRRHWLQGDELPDDESWLEVDLVMPTTAECAKLTAPLCYQGICASNQTIELFVKRIPATRKSNQAASKGIFIMDGGPGAASCDMEDLQQRTWKAMRGEVDVYVHDPRGTGRSEKLKCVSDKTADLPACLARLNKVYGNKNAAGFSLTSAATDLVAMTKSINPKAEWYLYGVSYGTLLAARTMHVGDAFKGYIFDSVTPERWEDAETSFNDVALRYLKACEDDKFCRGHVKTPLAPQVKGVYSLYDKTATDGVQKCRDWLRVQMSLRKEEPTSFGLKKLFAFFIRSQSKQRLFPPLLLRLARCNDADFAIFKGTFTKFLDSEELEDNILFPYDSRQLNQLIEASEIMQAADYNQSIADFRAELIDLPEYDALIPFCYYHNSSFPECKSLNLLSVQPFAYKKDRFFDTFATIPARASVLILNGVYDPITPDGWALAQFEGLDGDDAQKAFYNLDQVGHSVVDSPCGFDLYKQYLRHGGALAKIDPKCIKSIPKLPFTIPATLSQAVFGVDDIYASLSDSTTTIAPTTTQTPPTTATPTTTTTILPTTTTTKNPTTTVVATTTGTPPTTASPTTTHVVSTTNLPTKKP